MDRLKRNWPLIAIGILGAVIIAVLLGKSFEPPTFPGLPAVVGELRKAKLECEGKGCIVKRERAKGAIKDPDTLRDAETLYTNAMSKFNGVVLLLLTGLDTGFDEQTLEKLRSELADASRDYRRFREWFDRNFPIKGEYGEFGASSDALDWLEKLLPGLEKAVARLYEDFKKQSDEQRENIRQSLRECQFEKWDALR